MTRTITSSRCSPSTQLKIKSRAAQRYKQAKSAISLHGGAGAIRADSRDENRGFHSAAYGRNQSGGVEEPRFKRRKNRGLRGQRGWERILATEYPRHPRNPRF